MRFLLRLFFVAFIFYVAGAVLRRLLLSFSPRKQTGSQQKDSIPSAGQLVKDPVCGMYVVAETALTERRGSERFSFCSENCRQKFISSPTG